MPLLRHEAIDAAIRQAEDNLRAAEVMRRHADNDIKAQIIMDIIVIRDADRQLELLERTVLPRARQSITVARSAYESGRELLFDYVDEQRSLVVIQRLGINLGINRAKRMAEIEAIIGRELSNQGDGHDRGPKSSSTSGG